MKSAELDTEFELRKIISSGYIPNRHLVAYTDIGRFIHSYIGDYLREEAAGESSVRNLSVITHFPAKASLPDLESPL